MKLLKKLELRFHLVLYSSRKMTTKGNKELEAIDLLIQDLNTVHSDIRTEAKEKNCEKELDEWKEEVLEYLTIKRGKIW